MEEREGRGGERGGHVEGQEQTKGCNRNSLNKREGRRTGEDDKPTQEEKLRKNNEGRKNKSGLDDSLFKVQKRRGRESLSGTKDRGTKGWKDKTLAVSSSGQDSRSQFGTPGNYGDYSY